MRLNARQTQMLQTLSRMPEGLPIDRACELSGISVRTVYYDINAINESLRERGAGAVRIARRRIIADDVSWDLIDQAGSSSGRYYFTADERRTMELLHIALSGHRVTISQLMETFEVSRNTIISDIRELKSRLRGCGLEIASPQGAGYRIEGEERGIREALWNDLKLIDGVDCLTAARTFLQTALVEKTGEEIDFFELCRCLIKQYETDLNTRCFLEEKGLERMMIMVSWLRSLDGHWIKMGREEQGTLMGTLSYRSIQCSAIKLRQSGIVLPSEELLYITSLLLGIKTANFTDQPDEDAYVSQLAERLATNFERVSCLNFVDKPLVCEQMSNHIRPLYYRLKYGLQASSPLTVNVQKTYPMTFEFTKRAAAETGLAQLSDDEIGYLTIYLTAGLDRKMLEEGDTSSEKVLIIGAENNATITLLRRQIADACGIAFDYSFAELKKVRRWELDRYALVIALVPVPDQMRSDNMLETSPFLGEPELARIYEILRGNRIIARYAGAIDEIIDIFRRNLPACDQEALEADKLFFELFRYFNGNDYGFTERLPQAGEGLSFLDDRASAPAGASWRDVVRVGCEAICRRCGSTLLNERMANLMQSAKFQWYRMADEVVVVHCPMQGDERGRVMAQAVVCRGAIFPDQRPAGLVICLTTVDRYSHWGALYSIYQGLSDSGRVRALLADRAGDPAPEGGAA